MLHKYENIVEAGKRKETLIKATLNKRVFEKLREVLVYVNFGSINQKRYGM